MAHFAKIEKSIVTQVIVINNADCGGKEFPESEKIGKEFISSIGLDGEWVQTSYNKNFRKNFAATGYTFDRTKDAFIPPKPYSSWVLNTEMFQWEAPIPYPKGSPDYIWDENSKTWIK